MTIDWSRKRKLPRFASFSLWLAPLLVLALVLRLEALDGDFDGCYRAWHRLQLEGRREGWIADYKRIKHLIESRYPGLDWVVTEGGLDLYRLDLRTTALLERADSRKQAERILRDFVRAFHDGHLALGRQGQEWWFEGLPPDVTLSASAAGKQACKLLKYSGSDDADFDFGFKGSRFFGRLPAGNAFAAGRLAIDEHIVGFLRIPSFDPRTYGNTCVSEWERFRKSLGTTCESKCDDDFWHAMIERLLDDLATRIRQIKDAGADILLVDVRENPGGYGLFLRNAMTLLAGRELPGPEIAIAANEEAVGSLEEERRELERALALCPGESAPRKSLEAAYWRLDAAIAESRLPCDRSAVWSDWGARPGCPGLVPYQSPDDQTVAEIESASVRHGVARNGERHNPPARARWHGRLAVLTSRDTCSAAELLAGLLKDYAGATIIGQRTSGSGSGWLLWRTSWPLENTGLQLCIPDHVTYRRDGSAYLAGVVPDVPVRFDPKAEPSESAVGLFEALQTLLSKEQGT